MSSRSYLSPPRRYRLGIRRALLALFLLVAASFALPSLGIAALIWWRAGKTWDSREWWSGTWLLAIIGLLVYGCLTWLYHPLPSLLHSLSVALPPLAPEPRSLAVGLRWLYLLWLLHLCLAPVCALLLELLHPLSKRVSLLPLPFQHVRSKNHLPQAQRYAASLALASAPITPTQHSSSVAAPPLEPLGAYLRGELDEWVCGGQLCIPVEALQQHGTVLGEPGFGKTITLLQLAAIAARYGMQVIFLDLKGSQKTAVQFVAAMRHVGLARIKVFPSEAYDGWRGDANAIYNRLMALADPGTHPYYARVDATLVSLAVRAPCGPPRSSQDFLERLNATWLKHAYAGSQHWYEQRTIRKVRPHIDASSLAYDGFFSAANGGLDGTFACEDGDAVYIGLDGSALREQAANIGRYVLEDCAHYATTRKPVDLRTLVIIDEFGVLKTSNAANLYERVREAGMAMWAVAQSYQGLGAERASVLAASSIKVLHRCGDPEEVVRFAGWRDQPAFSHLLEEEGTEASFPLGSRDIPKTRTTVRMQRVYAVPIEDVQQLSRGAIALISGGLGAWCQVYPLALPPEVLQEATAFLQARPVLLSSNASEPAPTSTITGKTQERPVPESQDQRKKASETIQPGEAQRDGTPRSPISPSSVSPGSGATDEARIPNPQADEDDSPVDF
jgi:hypothetical protein